MLKKKFFFFFFQGETVEKPTLDQTQSEARRILAKVQSPIDFHLTQERMTVNRKLVLLQLVSAFLETPLVDIIDQQRIVFVHQSDQVDPTILEVGRSTYFFSNAAGENFVLNDTSTNPEASMPTYPTRDEVERSNINLVRVANTTMRRELEAKPDRTAKVKIFFPFFFFSFLSLRFSFYRTLSRNFI